MWEIFQYPMTLLITASCNVPLKIGNRILQLHNPGIIGFGELTFIKVVKEVCYCQVPVCQIIVENTLHDVVDEYFPQLKEDFKIIRN